jgi:GT2 family glycosyltransferase
MDLSVIIVSHNVKTYLEQCLHSLGRASEGIDTEVWVVDNASTDGTAAWLPETFPGVRLMALEENIGFAKANNLLLPLVSGKHILFLNPDTLMQEDCLKKCLAFMDGHKDAGALGVRMINGFCTYLPESKRGMPGARASFYKMSGLAERYPRHPVFAAYHLGHLDPRSTQAVPVLSGAFLMVRAEVIRKTGGFDEQFFMFGEDIDLSYRIRQAGWTNYYFADTTLVHFKGQSTDKDSDAYARHFFGAMTLFVRKYYTGSFAFWYRRLLRTGITLQKIKTRLRRPQLRHWTPRTARLRQCLIVGSVEDTTAFLTRYDPGRLFYLTLHPESTPLTGISQHMGLDGASPVLFCIGDLTYGEVIRWMDRSQWEPPCFFHDMHSDGIIGPGKEWPIPFRLREPGPA